MTGGNTYALLRPEVDLWKLETVLVERHSTWTLYGTTYKVKAFLLGQFPSFSRGLSVISGITAAMGLLILLSDCSISSTSWLGLISTGLGNSV